MPQGTLGLFFIFIYKKTQAFLYKNQHINIIFEEIFYKKNHHVKNYSLSND
jgi:hypothetical protein